MRATIRLAFLLPVLLCSADALAQVMKCVDAKGRVEYAKTCATGTTEATTIQRNGTQSPIGAPAAPVRQVPPGPREVGPDELDSLEANICGASTRVANAKAALAKKDSVPVEGLAGAIKDGRRRDHAQQSLDTAVDTAQKTMVSDFVNELARYQDEYRRVTGAEFNTALCGDTRRRAARREAWENRRRDERLQKQADELVASEPEAVRTICREKQNMDGAARRPEGMLPADVVREGQERSRVAYARLVASYERTHSKQFDPARCP